MLIIYNNKKPHDQNNRKNVFLPNTKKKSLVKVQFFFYLLIIYTRLYTTTPKFKLKLKHHKQSLYGKIKHNNVLFFAKTKRSRYKSFEVYKNICLFENRIHLIPIRKL